MASLQLMDLPGNVVLTLALLLLLQTGCEGLEFNFKPSSPTADIAGASQVCGVLQCKEMLAQSEPADHSRKIVGLTIYKRASGDGMESKHWSKLAKITSQSPRENRVSDTRHISGVLTETQATLTLELLKKDECRPCQFSCLAVLVNSANQTTLIQSFVGDQLSTSQDYGMIIEESDSLHMPREQLPTESSVQHLTTPLTETLKCMETRLEDSSRKADRLESNVESLKTTVTDKIHGLENTARDLSRLTENRVEDRLDRLENRLEDKLLTSAIQQTTCSRQQDNGKFEQVINHIAKTVDAIQSRETNLSCSDDQFSQLETQEQQRTSATTALESRLASLVSEVTNLVHRVDTLAGACPGASSVTVQEYFDVLGTGKKEWRLAFRGTAYNNELILPAFLHGTGIPAYVEPGCKQFNHSLPCINHYRNRDALENWENVDEVLFGVYRRGQLVKKIVFNGHGSTPTTWFEENRVILSSWDDLKTKSHNFFSMEGELRPPYRRRFFINHSYKTCEISEGWFFVGESTGNGCAMEESLAKPIFQYASGSTMAVWKSNDMKRADAIGIFLKYN